MLSRLLFGVLHGMLACIFGNAQGLQISKLTDDVYVYTTFQNYKGNPVPSNSLYILTDDGVVLIDTPWDTTQIKPLIDTLRLFHASKIIATISTHFHEDRTAGVNYLKSIGVRTFASRKTIQLCKQKKFEVPALEFHTDTTLNFGNRKIQIFYPGAGHTPDNIVVWLEKEKILFGGCLVKSVDAGDLGNIADADLSAWPETMEKLMKKFPSRKYVIPGHQSWSDVRSPEHTLKLLKENRNK